MDRKFKSFDDLIDHVLGITVRDALKDMRSYSSCEVWMDSLPYQEDRQRWEGIARKYWDNFREMENLK